MSRPFPTPAAGVDGVNEVSRLGSAGALALSGDAPPPRADAGARPRLRHGVLPRLREKGPGAATRREPAANGERRAALADTRCSTAPLYAIDARKYMQERR